MCIKNSVLYKVAHTHEQMVIARGLICQGRSANKCEKPKYGCKFQNIGHSDLILLTFYMGYK